MVLPAQLIAEESRQVHAEVTWNQNCSPRMSAAMRVLLGEGMEGAEIWRGRMKGLWFVEEEKGKLGWRGRGEMGEESGEGPN